MTQPEQGSLPWRKSSESQDNTGCVEVAVGSEHVYVRNSRHGDGPVLTFMHGEWEAFLAGVLKGEFRLPATDTD